MRNYISFLSHIEYGILLWQPEEITQHSVNSIRCKAVIDSQRGMISAHHLLGCHYLETFSVVVVMGWECNNHVVISGEGWKLPQQSFTCPQMSVILRLKNPEYPFRIACVLVIWQKSLIKTSKLLRNSHLRARIYSVLDAIAIFREARKLILNSYPPKW